jgi:TPP-dependent pyruvate/acetoin dehydrogenase alpha subunit
MTTTITADTDVSWVALRNAYKVMRTIRTFEERLHTEFATGEIPGAVHLYAGQEAVAAGVCTHLGIRDIITSTHRGHGHAIAKGSDVTDMMLEVYGKARGLCHGVGGSMHIADLEVGLLGGNGVAAAGAPLACGAALSAKLRKTRYVAAAFLGDGAANQGAFAESLSLAAVWQLPVIFVVEDNGYAQATGTSYHLRGIDVAERARGYGIPAEVVDGSDFFAVYAAAANAVARARGGGGPSLVECKAMRFFGHMEGFDQQKYRAPGETDRLRKDADPLEAFIARTVAENRLAREELDELDQKIVAMIDAAVAVAKNAPAPAPGADGTYTYTS